MNDEQEVASREQQWIDLYLANDADGFAELLTDDFFYTSPRGEFIGKPLYVENLRRAVVRMEYLRPSEAVTRIHGDVAVVTCRVAVKETYKGKTDEGDSRLTRVWIKSAQGWKAIAYHVTDYPREKQE